MPRKSTKAVAEKAPVPPAQPHMLAFTPASRRRFRAAGELDFDAEVRYAQQLLANSPTLLKAADTTPESLANALLDGARMGLSLSPALSHAYLVPRRVNDVWHVFFVPSYRGLEAMCLRSGNIQMIQSDLVFEKDEYREWTDANGKNIEHVVARGDRGAFERVYTMAFFANGRRHIEVMSAKDIAAVKAQATKMNFGKLPVTWEKWEDEMRKKSNVRRAWKHWPHDTIIATAMEAIAKAEPMSFDDEPDVAQEEPLVTEAMLDDILEALASLGDPLRHTWIERGAQAMGFLKPADLPASKVPELKERLVARLNLVNERKKAGEQS